MVVAVGRRSRYVKRWRLTGCIANAVGHSGSLYFSHISHKTFVTSDIFLIFDRPSLHLHDVRNVKRVEFRDIEEKTLKVGHAKLILLLRPRSLL